MPKRVLLTAATLLVVCLQHPKMESIADLSAAQKSELVVSLAALLLEDAEVELSAENLDTVVKVTASCSCKPFDTSHRVSMYWLCDTSDVQALGCADLPIKAHDVHCKQSQTQASGNTIESYWTSLFATYLEKAGGCEKFMLAPGAGGGGGGGGAAAASGGAAAAAVEKAPEPEEEEVSNKPCVLVLA